MGVRVNTYNTPDLIMPVDCSALTASGLPIVWVLGGPGVARELSVTRLWQSMATLTCPLGIYSGRRWPLAQREESLSPPSWSLASWSHWPLSWISWLRQ